MCNAVLIGAIGLAFLGTAGTAAAAPPPDPDPALAAWFDSLKQPGTGARCCSIADCRPSPYQQTAEGYRVLMNGRWRDIPPDKILQKTGNPTGEAIVCSIDGQILCFVRPADS
jgi:hypothetical protein